MSMLLKNHGDVLLSIQDENVLDSLQKWYESHESKTDKFDDLVKYCSGIIGLLTSV